MYLASFDTDRDQLLQGCVRLAFPPLNDSALNNNWRRELERLLRFADSVKDITISLRLLWGRTKTLEHTLLISAPAHQEPDLRRYFGSFIRLENIFEGSITVPLTREEHDALVDDFPRYCCRVAAQDFAHGEVLLACDFRVGPLLSDLFAEAETLGYNFGYQVHVKRLTIDSASVREARKNALRVCDLRGVPEAVVIMQQRLVESLLNATAVSEEFVAADSLDTCAWLRDTLQRYFRREFASLKFDVPEFEFSEGVYDEILQAGVHSSMFSGLSANEICCSAVDDRGAVGLLGWYPSTELMGQLAIRTSSQPLIQLPETAAESQSLPLPDRTLPAPYDGDQPFIFVSYKHQDLGELAPILHYITKKGYNVWYDKGIQGGTEWDAVIEKKLMGCSLVLLFVSKSAINSKYVRREAKFADILNKPIVSVKLEEANLTYGMGMLLTQYQMINRKAGDFEIQLQRAIDHVLTAARA